jgi:site-specific DNA recombinase
MVKRQFSAVVVERQKALQAKFLDPSSNVWAYTRVSSEQQDEGQSPEVQAEDIKKYCIENKLAAPVIVHESASAKRPMLPVTLPGLEKSEDQTVSPRPLLLLLLGHIVEKPGRHLIIWKLDRLARLAYEQEMLLELLRRRGVTVHSVQATEQTLLSGEGEEVDPARVFFRQIMGAVAQYERSLIQFRMTAGSRMKASKGGWVGGSIPYGYRVKNNDLIIDPATAEIVRLIFYYRDEFSLSYEKIATELHILHNLSGWHRVRIFRIMQSRAIYQGLYVDPYGGCHPRPELRILPENWEDWTAVTRMTIPRARDAISVHERLERVPVYGQDN